MEDGRHVGSEFPNNSHVEDPHAEGCAAIESRNAITAFVEATHEARTARSREWYHVREAGRSGTGYGRLSAERDSGTGLFRLDRSLPGDRDDFERMAGPPLFAAETEDLDPGSYGRLTGRYALPDWLFPASGAIDRALPDWYNVVDLTSNPRDLWRACSGNCR